MLGGFDSRENAAFEDYLRRCVTALGGEPLATVRSRRAAAHGTALAKRAAG